MAATRLTQRQNMIPSPLRSEEYVSNSMPPVIGNFSMTSTYVIALFLITNAVSGAAGGPVSLVYLVVGAITFFLPCVIATAQLGVMFPYEGGIYNWTYKALGSNWAFFVSLCYWITGVLASITGADAFVTTLQGLNNSWLSQPWQQGLVIMGLIVFSTMICIQRFRTTQFVVNSIFLLTMGSVCLIGLAAFVWLATGHASATNFTDPSGWQINQSNFFLLSIITLNFIGVNGPMALAGEIKARSVITSHLKWGSLIVFSCYAVVTVAVLVVRGPAMVNAPVLPFEGFTAVYSVLGKFAGSLSVLFFLAYGLLSVIFYSYISSRLILVAAIDSRLPTALGKLNKNRVPAVAVLVQLIFGGFVVGVVFFLVPQFTTIGANAAITLVDIYSILSAATTLIWTIATAFLFVNLVTFFRRRISWTEGYRIFHPLVIWYAIIIGSVACVLTIVGILAYSWIPQYIPGGTWGYVVGGLTAMCLIIVGLFSVVGRGEADFESMQEE